MTKSHSIKINILVSSVFILSVFLFLFAGKGIFAMVGAQINLNLWKWEELRDHDGKVSVLSLTEYLGNDQSNCRDIVIPNLFDLKEADPEKYQDLKRVIASIFWFLMIT